MIPIGFTGSMPDSLRFRILPIDAVRITRPCASSPKVEMAIATGNGGHKYGLMAVGTSMTRWVTLAAAVAQTIASRYPICWANHRLDAPASSAARQTSSIPAVDENPSKNTPPGIAYPRYRTSQRHG